MLRALHGGCTGVLDSLPSTLAQDEQALLVAGDDAPAAPAVADRLQEVHLPAVARASGFRVWGLGSAPPAAGYCAWLPRCGTLVPDAVVTRCRPDLEVRKAWSSLVYTRIFHVGAHVRATLAAAKAELWQLRRALPGAASCAGALLQQQ